MWFPTFPIKFKGDPQTALRNGSFLRVRALLCPHIGGPYYCSQSLPSW